LSSNQLNSNIYHETNSNSDHTLASSKVASKAGMNRGKNSPVRKKAGGPMIKEEDHEIHEQRLVNLLRNYCKDNFEMQAKEIHQQAFKRICNFSGSLTLNKESDLKIENEKCEKGVFKRFLEARYDKRLAQKILVLFDWSNNSLKFEKFTERIHEFILKPSSGG
jgi:hypothetical protein